MTDKELRGCRQVLEKKRAELAAGMRGIEAIAVQQASDTLDQVLLAQERELEIDSLDRRAALARDVSNALERIRDGNYGCCLDCGEAISPRRLAVFPWAPLCISCQEAVERRGNGNRNHGPRGWLPDAA